MGELEMEHACVYILYHSSFNREGSYYLAFNEKRTRKLADSFSELLGSLGIQTKVR